MGIALCSVFFVAGTSWHTYDYLTEVPEGYVRTGFWELQPDPDRPELPVSPKSLEMKGQKVFIKGYDVNDPNAVTSVSTTWWENPWHEITVGPVTVTSGQVEVGVSTEGAANNWSHFDDATLTKLP